VKLRAIRRLLFIVAACLALALLALGTSYFAAQRAGGSLIGRYDEVIELKSPLLRPRWASFLTVEMGHGALWQIPVCARRGECCFGPYVYVSALGQITWVDDPFHRIERWKRSWDKYRHAGAAQQGAATDRAALDAACFE
jgi:hypothetical protein